MRAAVSASDAGPRAWRRKGALRCTVPSAPALQAAQILADPPLARRGQSPGPLSSWLAIPAAHAHAGWPPSAHPGACSAQGSPVSRWRGPAGTTLGRRRVLNGLRVQGRSQPKDHSEGSGAPSAVHGGQAAPVPHEVGRASGSRGSSLAEPGGGLVQTAAHGCVRLPAQRKRSS